MKFSVIVPVYNAEQYLDKCISSVIQQSYDNWELILVDDGSTDHSPQIADKYASRDKRITVIHQSNSGAGLARNNGIKQATGDYVVFLDSDDYIDQDYFSLILKKANNADVVFVDAMQIAPDGSVICKEYLSKYKSWSKGRILRAQMTGKIPWGGWRKIVKRIILLENEIWFSDHKVGEEALFSFRVVHAAKTVGFLDVKPVYYYVNHDGSLSKAALVDPWGDVADDIAGYLKANGLYRDYADTVNAFQITALVVSVDRINLLYDGMKKKEYLRGRIMAFQNSYDFEYGIDRKSMSIKAMVFIPFVLRGITWPIEYTSSLRKHISFARKVL